MKTKLATLGGLFVALFVITGAWVARSTDAADLHFGLLKSVPADSARVPSVSEVRLWFTEEPEEGTVAIRLLDGGGALVRTGAMAQDAKEKTVFAVPTNAPLAAGQYSIAWRGMGADGHVIQGNLTFWVTTP